MTPAEIGISSFLLLFLLIAMNVPVAYALGLVGVIFLWVTGGANLALATMTTLPYESVAQYSLAIVPLFVLMGSLAAAANITTDLYDALYKWLSRSRGSLYSATILASAGFAAVSGSTVVNSVVFTRIALPQMIRHGYDRGIAAACIAAAGTFAALIPPALTMVFYAILTGESIGRLLIAGIIPGILTVIVYLVGIRVMIAYRPSIAPVADRRFTIGEKMRSLVTVLPIAALCFIVMGGIYGGYIFPSAAGAVGATGALLIALAMRRLSWQGFVSSVKDATSTAGVMLLVILGGLLFSRMLVFSGFIDVASAWVLDMGATPLSFMIGLVVCYIILGIFVDPVPMLVITIPIFYPIAQHLEIDSLWLAVIIVKLMELAVISPPVGLNLFAVISAADKQVTTAELFRGMIPFFLLECVTLAILMLFPSLSTWLPSIMM